MLHVLLILGEPSKSVFGNSITQESQAVIGDLDTESVNSSVSSRFSYLTGEQSRFFNYPK